MGLSATDYISALPEIVLLGSICGLLIATVFLKRTRDAVLHYGSLIAIAALAIITSFLFQGHRTLAFHGLFIQDGLGDVLNLFCYAITGAIFVYARPYLKGKKLFSGEFYVLMLFALGGAMIIIQAYSLLILYLGVELLSLAMYALIALSRDDGTATEAAMKFFVLGAISAGAFLFGLSWIYGLTGTLNIGVLSAHLFSMPGTSVGLWVGLGFVVLAMAFEIGAVPFHMWLPDVYEGAPASMVAFIGSVPKIAAFAFFIRLLAEGMQPLHDGWLWLLTAIAVASLGIGAVVGIAQGNIKRMLAYSTINHAGFILLGILAGNALGYRAAMFYVLAYAIMFIGAFGIIILMSRAGFEAEKIEDFKGLNDRSPWFALVMAMMMFSMAGVPPFIGFWAKVEVVKAVLNIHMLWLAVYAVVTAVIAGFYYLRIIWLMYFDHAEGEQRKLIADPDMKLLLSVNGLAILGLGIFPGGLLALCAIVFGVHP
jgi:NADH-quinone oxidoreductase subunit N